MFPLYIPIFMGGGGGGPSVKEAMTAAAIIGGIGGYMLYKQYHAYDPHVDLVVKRDTFNPKGFAVKTKEYHYPKIYSEKTEGLDCMRQKGYTIRENRGYKYGSTKTFDLCTVSHSEGARSVEAFVADCKECRVATEVRYKGRSALGNDRLVVETLQWSEKYKERLR